MRLGAYTHSTDKPYTAASIPARDRVIEFGKYRGKMLGTLPSRYLRWISKNLRARDFEEWSKFADEVLEDPIYRDRIEWEFAEGVLNGNRVATSSRTESAVSELMEISERFGWDNQDKAGWSRVSFELLGTSRGGRIPRRLPTTPSDRQDDKDLDEAGRGHGFGVKRRLALPEDEKRRRERRERLRLKRSDRYNYGEPYRTEVTGEVVKKRDRDANACARGRGGGGGEEEETSSDSGTDSSGWTVEEDVYNPFPGRDGLLKKVLHLNRRRSL